MTKTKIEWADHNWNPIVGVDGGWGCNKVSPGCDHCYAEILHKRFGGRGDYDSTEHEFTIKQHILEAPLKRKVPTKYFVCSTMDLFHHNITIEQWMKVWNVIANSPQHIFIILTKRPESAWRFMGTKPLPNIWLGVSAENQKYWDKRVPILMSIPAAVRFVSVEPMLDQVVDPVTDGRYIDGQPDHSLLPDWVIIGGESGHGCRPVDVRHIQYLVLILKQFGVPTFVKQLGGHPDKRNRMEDWPEDLRIREYPQGQPK